MGTKSHALQNTKGLTANSVDEGAIDQACRPVRFEQK